MDNWTTKRWTNGAELMEALGIAPYELLAFIKDGLQVNDEYGRTLLFFKEPTPHVILKMMGWVYYGKDQETIVEEIETKRFYVKHVLQYLASKNLLHLVPQLPSVKPGNTTQIKPVSVPEGTKWRDIQIRVVEGTRLEIDAGNGPELFSYEQLKLDKREELRKILEKLAQRKNINSGDKAHIQRLKKEYFKELFPSIKENPLPWAGKTYKPAFDITFKPLG